MRFLPSILTILLICEINISALAGLVLQLEDSLLTPREKLIAIDSLIDAYDSTGNFVAALETSVRGLEITRELEDQNRAADFELKIAKYNYLRGDVKQSLIHFRLYSLLKETEIRRLKDLEILILEDAYLEELTSLSNELELNEQLIRNLQAENERYYLGQKKISTAINFGIGAIIIIAAILLYNRFYSRNKKIKKTRYENKELQRLTELAGKYDDEQKRNLQSIDELKNQKKQNAWYARHIQKSIIPGSDKLKKYLKNTFILNFPRNSISGDFYAIHESDDRLVLAVLDCPGHGTDAVYSTILSYHFLNEIFQKGITAPSMILTMLDQKLKYEFDQNDVRPEEINGVKIAICEINKTTKEIEYSGAHFPLFYVHLDELHFVRGNRFPVGDPLFTDKFYSSDHIHLSTGDIFYLTTDGFYSQFGGKKNKKFMRSSLINLLKNMCHQKISEQEFILDKVFKEWKARNDQTDDVLIIGVRL